MVTYRGKGARMSISSAVLQPGEGRRRRGTINLLILTSSAVHIKVSTCQPWPAWPQGEKGRGGKGKEWGKCPFERTSPISFGLLYFFL